MKCYVSSLKLFELMLSRISHLKLYHLKRKTVFFKCQEVSEHFYLELGNFYFRFKENVLNFCSSSTMIFLQIDLILFKYCSLLLLKEKQSQLSDIKNKSVIKNLINF